MASNFVNEYNSFLQRLIDFCQFFSQSNIIRTHHSLVQLFCARRLFHIFHSRTLAFGTPYWRDVSLAHYKFKSLSIGPRMYFVTSLLWESVSYITPSSVTGFR